MAKKHLSIDDWHKVGRAIKSAQKSLEEAVHLLNGGVSIDLIDKIVIIQQNRIGKVKSKLEDVMLKQHPSNKDDALLSVFYGQGKEIGEEQRDGQ